MKKGEAYIHCKARERLSANILEQKDSRFALGFSAVVHRDAADSGRRFDPVRKVPQHIDLIIVLDARSYKIDFRLFKSSV